MSEKPTTAWLEAYNEWLPAAIINGDLQVSEAFRAGYLAALADMRGPTIGDIADGAV